MLSSLSKLKSVPAGRFFEVSGADPDLSLVQKDDASEGTSIFLLAISFPRLLSEHLYSSPAGFLHNFLLHVAKDEHNPCFVLKADVGKVETDLWLAPTFPRFVHEDAAEGRLHNFDSVPFSLRASHRS